MPVRISWPQEYKAQLWRNRLPPLWFEVELGKPISVSHACPVPTFSLCHFHTVHRHSQSTAANCSSIPVLQRMSSRQYLIVQIEIYVASLTRHSTVFIILTFIYLAPRIGLMLYSASISQSMLLRRTVWLIPCRNRGLDWRRKVFLRIEPRRCGISQAGPVRGGRPKSGLNPRMKELWSTAL